MRLNGSQNSFGPLNSQVKVTTCDKILLDLFESKFNQHVIIQDYRFFPFTYAFKECLHIFRADYLRRVVQCMD